MCVWMGCLAGGGGRERITSGRRHDMMFFKRERGMVFTCARISSTGLLGHSWYHRLKFLVGTHMASIVYLVGCHVA